jgi:hypothetical protein
MRYIAREDQGNWLAGTAPRPGQLGPGLPIVAARQHNYIEAEPQWH